ncbi:hypothetical protein Vadar_005758 [Vaccinium darrowii]|uniref:Uncharacterized protein n=1 Tax=Vaccinium darrowii TaxID=229202 RepID=A0ACB7ZIS7_9ERIC|nr:hypothetical protein Vadar_005758 [Vaccinium darrowii]
MAGRAYSLLGFLALQKIALAFGISRSGRLSIAVGTALGRPFIVLRLLLHRRCIKGTHKSTCRLRIMLSGLGKRKKFKSVNKDKLLQMAGFGAKMVFSSKDTIADEDIERIIAKGEEATNELDD